MRSHAGLHRPGAVPAGPEFGMPKTELVFVPPDFAKGASMNASPASRGLYLRNTTRTSGPTRPTKHRLTRYLRAAWPAVTTHRREPCLQTRRWRAARHGSPRLARRRGVEELRAGTGGPTGRRRRRVIVEVEEDDDDDEPRPSREERIAALEAELARARSVVDDAAGAFEELRARGIDVSSGDMDVVAQHVKKRLAEISAAVDALPALDFVGNDKAGALAERVLDEMRASVRDATGGLTLSGGLGPNFRLAKVAADQKKPDGQFRVGAGKAAVLEFLRDLPCRKIGGIGRVLEMKLSDALNVRTCGDLIDNLPECYCVLGKSAAMGFLHEVALGCGECGGPTDDGDEDDERVIRRKGLGNERTFRPVRGSRFTEKPFNRWARLRASGYDMRAAKWTLKLKTTDFRISTRDTQTKKTARTNTRRSVKSIVKLLKPLLLEAIGEAEAAGKIRLMGVRSSDLEGQHVPLARGQTT